MESNKMGVFMMHLYKIWPITVKPRESKVLWTTLYLYEFMHCRNIP